MGLDYFRIIEAHLLVRLRDITIKNEVTSIQVVENIKILSFRQIKLILYILGLADTSLAAPRGVIFYILVLRK